MTDDVQLQDQIDAPVDTANVEDGLPESNAPAQQEIQLSDAVVQKIAEQSAKAFRAMQSMKDKKARQVLNETQKMIDNMKSAGVEIDEAKERAIRQNALDQMTDVDDNDGNVPFQAPPISNQQPPPKSDQAVDAFNQSIQELYQEYGVVIDQNAPGDEKYREMIDTTSPRKFQKTLEAALQKKANDLNTPPAARIPTLAGSGKTTQPSVDQYKKEMFAARGDKQKVTEVKEKFIKLGLDVDAVNLWK